MKSKETVKQIQTLIEGVMGTNWCVSDLDIYASGIAMLSLGLRDNKQLSEEDGTHPAILTYEIYLSFDKETMDGGSSLEVKPKTSDLFEALDDSYNKDYYLGLAMLLADLKLKWSIVDTLSKAVEELKAKVA